MKRKKSILITGANGFIGSFLVEKALELGFVVYAGVRNTSDLTYLKDKRIRLLEMDISNKQHMIKLLNGDIELDFIIHNAGITKTCDNAMFDKVNFQYTKLFIDAILESKQNIEKFIFISSLAAAGPVIGKEIVPRCLVDEPQPVTYYGHSKLKAENYLKSKKDFPYLIFRPTGVFGPREKDFLVLYRSLNRGLETYIGSKNQYLTFIYVKDLVRLILLALESEVKFRTYFASDMNYYTAMDFNSVIKKRLDKKTIVLVIPEILVKIVAFLGHRLSCGFRNNITTLNIEKFKEISSKNWLCDSSDLNIDFGFHPSYQLDEAMNETLTWYLEKNLL